MSNSDTAVQNNRVPIPGSELSMPAPPPEAHWTVYKITGPDGKVYIGQTGQPLKVRWWKGYHLSYKTGMGAISDAMKKFGKVNFRMEALCENLTQEGAWELEAKFIELYDSMNPEKGYNGKTGGRDKGCKMYEAARQKFIQHYEQSSELRKAMSDGVKRWYENNPEIKMHLSDVMKRRCAEGKNDAFIYSDSRPKPVQCIETGVVYSSQNEAYRMTGIRHIHEACTGAYVYAGGFHWRFVNQVKPGIIPTIGRGGKKRQA